MPSAVSSGSPLTDQNRRPALKKRFSNVGASTSSPVGSPLQPWRRENQQPSPHMAGPGSKSSSGSLSSTSGGTYRNDDAAEKASRRKSAHFGDLAQEGGREKAAGHSKRVVSALAMQQASAIAAAQAAAGGSSQSAAGGSGGIMRRGKRLSAVAPSQPAMPQVSMEVMSKNFEEWIKMSTDNKITATNTWNFALIDYFAEMTLLRNGPDDQSINFQKASCTLDGCVKIWTSRVDSVATETGKLLSGLAGGGGAEDDGEEGGEGEEGEDGEPKAARKTHRSEATLAKSFAALQIKKFDLEFTVDPLFKKTSADFDEGGAMGLLMNHLGVDGRGRVVFDAGDAGVEEEDDEVAEDEMISLDRLREFIPTPGALSELAISDTLSSFKFSSDPASMPDITSLLGLKDSWDDNETARAASPDDFGTPTPGGVPGEVHDFFGDEDFDVGHAAPTGFDDGASMAGDDEEQYGSGAASGGAGGGLGMAGSGDQHAPFDPRRPGGDLVMALVGNEGAADENMFDYFDKGFGKTWAGQEHWRLKKVTRKDAAAPATTRTAKAPKAPFTIDFSAAVAGPSSKTLFAPAPRATLSLPSAANKRGSSRKSGSRRGSEAGDDRGRVASARRRKDEWLLPDDMHFSSRQLLRLFLKPKFALRVRKNAKALRTAENMDGEIDENFWAQAAADRVEGSDPGGMGGMPTPFESQFFNDGDDDGDAGDYAFIDDALDEADGGAARADLGFGGDGEDEDLMQATQGQQLKRARPENVHFSKKAKRVDVKRLKDDIWKGLKDLAKPADEATAAETDEDVPVTPTDEPKTFNTIISSLRSSYPQDKMSEISTSFCFICLLHLANEEGLRIETARFDGLDGEDVGCKGLLEEGTGRILESPRKGLAKSGSDVKRDRTVGELQALKVYKDPNAGRAA